MTHWIVVALGGPTAAVDPMLYVAGDFRGLAEAKTSNRVSADWA